MKLLIDTNIVLDVLLKREPFCELSAKVLGLCSRKDIHEYVSASSITDIYYIARRQMKSKDSARKLLQKLLRIISVAGVTEEDILMALRLDWTDFEDSVQYAVAVMSGFDGVVTRNPEDFKNAEITVWQPEALLTALI